LAVNLNHIQEEERSGGSRRKRRRRRRRKREDPEPRCHSLQLWLS
jgi:hypothetical protein